MTVLVGSGNQMGLADAQSPLSSPGQFPSTTSSAINPLTADVDNTPAKSGTPEGTARPHAGDPLGVAGTITSAP